MESAGLYDEEEARRHTRGVEGTFAIPENVAREFFRTVVYVDDKQKLIDASVQR